MRRVVITSVGVVTPVGQGWAAFEAAMRAGTPGGRRITAFDPSPFATQVAAEVRDFDPQEPFLALAERAPETSTLLDAVQDRKTALGLAAALECADASGLDPEQLAQAPMSVHLGTGLSSVTVEQLELDLIPFLDDSGRYDRAAFARQALRLASPAPWRHVVPEASRLIQAALGLRQGVQTTTNFAACAASLQAIGRGLRDIQAGRADRALVGGMDSMVHPFGMISFLRLGALTEYNSDPAGASRPFDRNRDGFLLGEGAAMVLLEALDVAQARGAHILAEVLGYGTSIDAHMVTAPHPEGRGARMAMERALKDAAVHPREVDYVNAHGTGTPLNDSTESKAIRSVWERAGLTETAPVSSTKSMTGHLIAAAGALEAVACVGALRGGYLPPSINIKDLDPACDVQVIQASSAPSADVRIALTNSFGFGGQNAAMVLGHWEGAGR